MDKYAKLVTAALLALTPFAATRANEPAKTGEPGAPHISLDHSGIVGTRDGLALRLTTDLGTVRIVSLEAGAAPAVRYAVHLETDARGPAGKALLERYELTAKSTPNGVEINGTLPAQAAHLAGKQVWVQFEVAVPPSFSVEVNTEAGDIEAKDIGGTAVLTTQGGNITTGKIGEGLHGVAVLHTAAKLETGGGIIQVKSVNGDLIATTAGGHITLGSTTGDANLHTGGGHISAGTISGRATLDTGGGNITVGHTGNFVAVHTVGGQIDFGEVRGSVHAQTGGGGIRVMYVSGPMEVESSGGSICLTRVSDSVRAATGSGTITAWINPHASNVGGKVHLSGASQLASGAGDIVVFLPRNLAANIDAVVESGGEDRIEFDPGLPVMIQPRATHSTGTLRAMAVLNGGGTPLKLRTSAGKIKLKFLDSETALRESLLRDQEERMKRNGVAFTPANYAVLAPEAAPEAQTSEDQPEWFETLVSRLEIAFTGGMRENADDFLKRMTSAPRPAYPELARLNGIQGTVRLQVRMTREGRVEVEKLLEGEPVLADAAIATVKKWQGKPAWSNGKKVNVISTVSFNFHLR